MGVDKIWPCTPVTLLLRMLPQAHFSGKKKQHKHKLSGPDFPRTFLTLTPGCPGVKKFLLITGAAEKRTFWCGRPRFSARTSMTRRVLQKLCAKKVCVDFLAPNFRRKFIKPRAKVRWFFSSVNTIQAGKSHPWTNTSVGGNFGRTFRTIGPYEFPQEKVWTYDWFT